MHDEIELMIPEDLSPVHASVLRWFASLWGETAESYRKDLNTVARLVNPEHTWRDVAWDKLDYATLSAIRERLHATGKSPATINRIISACKSLARQLARDEIIPRTRLIELQEVKRLPETRTQVGRMLAPAEIQRLWDACDLMPRAHRYYRALLAVLFGAGLRAREAVGFFESGDFRDYDPETGRLLVRYGKGRKMRYVYLTGRAKLALDEFVLRGDDRGRFLHITPTNAGGLRDQLRNLARKADVKPFSPHDCRRTYASMQLARGIDIVTLQHLMGHADPATTATYDRRGEKARKSAAFDPWAT